MEFVQQNVWLIVALVAWEFVWKGFALWRSARNNDKYWFVILLFVNTVGILPMLYLLLTARVKKNNP